MTQKFDLVPIQSGKLNGKETRHTVGHGSEWLPGATHPKNDPPYHSSKFWYIGGILAKEARLYLKLASNTEQIYLEGW